MLNKIKGISRNKNSRQYRVTILLGLFVLFWTMFDSIVSYISPILIESQGYSATALGLIIGSSSFFGAIFDFFISKVLKRADFRRIFILMMILSLLHPWILSQARGVGLWLLAMASWGIYFDLYGFGTFDYVGRHSRASLHAANFGIIQIFKALANVLGPLFVGLIIVEKIDNKIFHWQWLFLFIASIFLVLLIIFYNRRPYEIKGNATPKKPLILEFKIWKRVSKTLLPVLLITTFVFILDSFFWTLAPIFGEKHHWGGLFLVSFTLPSLIFGWYMGPITKKFGKKRTAFLGLLLGSIILSLFSYFGNSWLSMILIFLAACFFSLIIPAVDGAYADYISETPRAETEIAGLADFAFNVGYVAGPIIAGLLADYFGIAQAFSFIGVVGILISLILLKITPKSITVSLKKI